MSATEELRRLLDERGVEYEVETDEDGWAFMRWHGLDDTGWLAASDELCGLLDLRGRYLFTPEQAVEATLGRGECRFEPNEIGFTWWDENDVEHYEEHSASDECVAASCDKCGFSMIVGDCGWFRGWDEVAEWTEDGSESIHKGYVLVPIFNYCPNCGRRVVDD